MIAVAGQRLRDIRSMLQGAGLAPNKALGQNFLIDRNLVDRCVERSGVGPGDLVLEVGPGTGTLTEALLERGARVVAIELDRGLAALLRERFADRLQTAPDTAPNTAPNTAPAPTHHAQNEPDRTEPGTLTLIEGDALAGKRALNAAAAAQLGDRPFRLVANLPYGAATPLLLLLMCDWPSCDQMHVTIQREVADRLAAGPGSKAYGSISVVSSCVMPAERFAGLPAECFWPRPRVASSMVSLVRRARPDTHDPRALADFCQMLFSSRRKQLGAVLRAAGREPDPWPKGVEPTDRVEQLAPERIAALEHAAGHR